MATTQAPTANSTWKIDPSHSHVEFAVKHLMISTVKGRFADVEGQIMIVDGNPSASSVTATIKAASIDTRTEQRDEHLRSADFFDVAKYPEITFKSKRIAGDASEFMGHRRPDHPRRDQGDHARGDERRVRQGSVGRRAHRLQRQEQGSTAATSASLLESGDRDRWRRRRKRGEGLHRNRSGEGRGRTGRAFKSAWSPSRRCVFGAVSAYASRMRSTMVFSSGGGRVGCPAILSDPRREARNTGRGLRG